MNFKKVVIFRIRLMVMVERQDMIY